MNALGIALVWCMVQVTVVALLSGGLYFLLRKFWPAAGAAVVLTSLVVVLGLSLLVVSPWPQWHFRLDTTAPGAVAAAPSESATPASSADSETAAKTATNTTGGTEVAPVGPSPWALLWRTALAELSSPPTAAKASWQWPALVACLLGVGIVVQLVWFFAGTLAVRSYRSKSRPVADASLCELLDVLRAELGCTVPIELREVDGLATAATLGWRRPLVLVPSDWRRWSLAQRRAVLAHEVAHVRSNDFLAVLIGQLSAAVHFYHPLVHWLLGRLRLEQELAADALAAGVSGGQRSYLAAIAELALEGQDRPIPWPARSFLPTRNTLLRRIAMLRDAKLRFGRLSPLVRGVAVGAVLLCGLVVVGLRGPAGSPPALAQAPAPPVAAAAPEAEGAIDLSYVPEDAQGFLAVRPADLLRKLPTVAGEVEKSGQLREIGAVEQVVLVVPSGVGTTAAQATRQSLLAIAHMRTPESLKGLQDLLRNPRPGSPVTKKSFEGKDYYVMGEGPLAPAYFFPEECTLVQGPEDVVRQAMAGKSPSLPKILRQNGIHWNEFQKDQLVMVTMDVKPLLAALPGPITVNGAPLDLNSPTLAMFAPLWKSSQMMTLGMRLDRDLAVHGMALANDEPAAQQVEATLQATRTLAINALGQARAQMDPQREAVAEVLQVYDVLEKTLQGATIQRKGAAVEAAMTVTLSSHDLDALVKHLQAAMRAGNQPQQITNKLKNIALAMHNYDAAYRCFPPAVLYGPDGKTPYSWRVALLPYLEQQDLYKQYRQDEPWDSPNNLKVLEKMPDVYRMPSEPADSTRSCFFVLTGPETIFSDKKGTNISKIPDGTSNTVLVVEAKRDIPWTKPEDIPYDAAQPLPQLGGYSEGGFWVALADGSVRRFGKDVSEKVLRALITKAGGEIVEVPN